MNEAIAVNEADNLPEDFSKWTKVQKLAGFLLLLTPENSTAVMKQLGEDQLEAVCAEMTKLRTISQEFQEKILEEFSSVALDASTAVRGGVGCVQSLLEKSVGLFRASDILGRVSPCRAPVAAMQQIVEMDPRHLFNLLRHEQPQTIAMIVSYLPPEKASSVLSLMRAEVREAAIERLATLAPTSIEAVEDVVFVLRQKSGNNRTRALNQTGGAKIAAQVLNAFPKNITDSILLSIKERNPELGEAVRQKMFTFEELARLDSRDLQTLLQTVDRRTLVVALKTASEKLKSVLLGAMSKRGSDTVLEELSFMEPLKLREIEAAQFEIVETAKRLENDGEIELDQLRSNSRYLNLA